MISLASQCYVNIDIRTWTLMQELLEALAVFTQTPDKVALARANSWLQDFQHSPEAWSTCNVLLLSADTPPAVKLFAAQTFRSKVTYDLNQVDPVNLLPLRDTLVSALQQHHTGPKTIIIQLCLALAGLALQLPQWENAVQSMINGFGQNPATVPALLEFLILLPEELNTNTRIPVTDDEYRERAAQLLTANSKTVLDLLSMYIQASGVTSVVQNQVFRCLRSWLLAGEINIQELSETALFGFAFEALASDVLFDSAVDVLCELIHETQEIDDNMPVIELIVPRVIALKPQLSNQSSDPDKIRGYARIFAEAGETYRLLLLHHPDTFFPIVEAIGECSAYPDLDIVPITFPFWQRLAQIIGKKPSISPLFQEAYKSLMLVIIRHLHFPSDESSHTGEEADSFRSFRHIMGDTLKDCCFVLGPETCLGVMRTLVTTALSQTAQPTSWQAIEAPLFALRSVGAEINPRDETAVPQIMDLIPRLPNHPRVRYAALLILARYSEWINQHPQYLQDTLTYVSTGFQDSDQDVCAAAGQALKYLCQDCRQHLTEFLPTLHAFLSTSATKLSQDDRAQVYEAIAYVISAMPMDRAAESLRTFAADILSQAHNLVGMTVATKQDVQDVCDGLENLEIMLNVIKSFGDDLPASCQNTCIETWAVLDSLISKYGTDYGITERATRVLRCGVTFFGRSALPVASPCLGRMSMAFETTGFSSYMWIAGKLVGLFGNESDPAIRTSFQEVFDRSTHRVLMFLQSSSTASIPDVLEDYVQMQLQLVNLAPDVYFTSRAFPTAFKASMATLTLVHSDAVFAALTLFCDIICHDSLDTVPPPPKFVTYAAAIKSTVDKEGLAFVGCLLNGFIGDFPEDSTSILVNILRALATHWSSQLLTWLPPNLEQLPTGRVPGTAKTQFLSDITNAINAREFDKVKYAVLGLNRVARRTRERRGGHLDT
jgi:transportin-3